MNSLQKFSIVLVLTINYLIVAQNYIDYPINNGDFWQYQEVWFNEYYSVEVIGDTIFSNGILYKILKTDSGNKIFCRFYEDKVYNYNTTLGFEIIQYDFTLQPGDTVAVLPNGNDTLVIILSSITYKNIFGTVRKQWSFLYDWLCCIDDEIAYTISDGFGLTKTTNIFYQDTLCGAMINGITYGIIVSKENEVAGKPTEYFLSQNYPNPFNPSTKISWQSPVGSWQTLKIFDVLGNEIAILVDEYCPAGSHEIQWDAGDFPSGVYFYQIGAEKFIETKKMILMK